MIEWSKTMEVGNPTIDVQHRELVDKVNELMAAMKSGKGRQVVGDVLAFLGGYAVKHFGDEEAIMARTGYPGRAAHHQIHETFKADFGKLVAEYDANPTSVAVTIEVQQRVSNWLRNHILTEDQKVGAHLAAS